MTTEESHKRKERECSETEGYEDPLGTFYYNLIQNTGPHVSHIYRAILSRHGCAGAMAKDLLCVRVVVCCYSQRCKGAFEVEFVVGFENCLMATSLVDEGCRFHEDVLSCVSPYMERLLEEVHYLHNEPSGGWLAKSCNKQGKKQLLDGELAAALFGGARAEGGCCSVEGESVEGKSVEEESVKDKNVVDQSVEGKSVEGKSVEGKSVEGKSAQGEITPRGEDGYVFDRVKVLGEEVVVANTYDLVYEGEESPCTAIARLKTDSTAPHKPKPLLLMKR